MISRIPTILVFALCAFFLPRLSIADDATKKPDKSDDFKAVCALEGTWVATKSADGQKPVTVVIKPTAGGTAILETLGSGSDHEMVNVYTSDEKGVLLTHYCLLGNQPRMRLTSVKDGVLTFEYLDAGNLKSRDEMHMDSLVITVKGDRMTHDWSMYQDGKVTGHHLFELKRH